MVGVDRRGPDVRTSRTGHIYQQTSCCSRQKKDDGKRRISDVATGKRRMWIRRTSIFYPSYSARPLDQ